MGDVTEWLRARGLEEYASAFEAQRIGLDVLPELSDADLLALGVAALGDRKRLLRAIASMANPFEPGLDARGVVTSPAMPAAGRSAQGQTVDNEPEAQGPELRQLTTMFCDLVGSTELVQQLDAEDHRVVIDAFHATVAAAVAPFDGYVARQFGDGVLVYFGYPVAQEDAASRSVRAALAVLRALAAPAQPLPAPMRARIGIASGPVVVGTIAAGTPAAERSASGEAVNLAARLQGVAGIDEVLISDATRGLLDATILLSDLGHVTLKGFDVPMRLWRVDGERALVSRFGARQAAQLTPFVGRESEVALLLDRWALAREGEAQVVLLQGEAGIGKSRIGQTLVQRLEAEPHLAMLLQCSPYFAGSALHPIVQYLRHAAGIGSGDSRDEAARKLAVLTAGLAEPVQAELAALGGSERVLPAEPRLASEEAPTPRARLARTLDALVQWLASLSAKQPLLLWIEDVHWIDPTTEELIAKAIARLRGERLFTLLTSRPEHAPALGQPANLTYLTLSRLPQRHCAALVDAVAGARSLSELMRAEIIRRCDGVPLFAEELTKTVLQDARGDAGDLANEVDGRKLMVPSTLQDSLMARLDRLGHAKAAAQAGAAIGREFSYRLLAAALGPESARMDEALADLVGAELLTRREGEREVHFGFKHALVRDVAYRSMPKSQRMACHRRIAAALESEPASHPEPELLARHLQEGGERLRAAQEWAAAGKQAVERGANREAAAAFESALAQLRELPRTEANLGEALDIELSLGSLLLGYRGNIPQVLETYRRAQALADELGDSRRLYQALWGATYSDYLAGRFDHAVQSGSSLLAVASNDDDGSERIEAHHVLWTSLSMGGRPLEALAHIEQGEALYRPEQHRALRFRYARHDPGACCRSWRAFVCWMIGRPRQALAAAEEARLEVAGLQHPMTQIIQLVIGWTQYVCGNLAGAAQAGADLIEAGERNDFQLRADAAVVMRALEPGADRTPAALRDLSERLTKGQSSRTGKLLMGYILADLCTTAGAFDIIEPLLGALEDGSAHSLGAEHLRLRALVALQGSPADAARAEQCVHSAIEMARGQGATSLALRAATTLAEHWCTQGRGPDAVSLLEPMCAGYGDGLETPDMRLARAALERSRQGNRSEGNGPSALAPH